MHDDRAAGLLDRRDERLAIERRDGEEIDHLDGDAVLVAENVGGLERDAEHRAVGDQGEGVPSRATWARPIVMTSLSSGTSSLAAW